MSYERCPNCGASTQARDAFCPECRASLDDFTMHESTGRSIYSPTTVRWFLFGMGFIAMATGLLLVIAGYTYVAGVALFAGASGIAGAWKFDAKDRTDRPT